MPVDPAPDEPAEDIVSTGGAVSLRRQWGATSRANRWLAGAAATMAVAAAVAGLLASATQPHRRTRTLVVAPATAPPATVDALGCPVTATCSTAATIDAVLRTAMTRDFRDFGAVRVRSGTVTTDSATGRRYRVTILATVSGISLAVTSQCVPHGQAAPTRFFTAAVSAVDLAGNNLINSRRLTVVQPGRTGCSLAIEIDSPGSGFDFLGSAELLASDRTSQVASS